MLSLSLVSRSGGHSLCGLLAALSRSPPHVLLHLWLVRVSNDSFQHLMRENLQWLICSFEFCRSTPMLHTYYTHIHLHMHDHLHTCTHIGYSSHLDGHQLRAAAKKEEDRYIFLIRWLHLTFLSSLSLSLAFNPFKIHTVSQIKSNRHGFSKWILALNVVSKYGNGDLYIFFKHTVYSFIHINHKVWHWTRVGYILCKNVNIFKGVIDDIQPLNLSFQPPFTTITSQHGPSSGCQFVAIANVVNIASKC